MSDKYKIGDILYSKSNKLFVYIIESTQSATKNYYTYYWMKYPDSIYLNDEKYLSQYNFIKITLDILEKGSDVRSNKSW